MWWCYWESDSVPIISIRDDGSTSTYEEEIVFAIELIEMILKRLVRNDLETKQTLFFQRMMNFYRNMLELLSLSFKLKISTSIQPKRNWRKNERIWKKISTSKSSSIPKWIKTSLSPSHADQFFSLFWHITCRCLKF